jgi:hypothetical protein
MFIRIFFLVWCPKFVCNFQLHSIDYVWMISEENLFSVVDFTALPGSQATQWKVVDDW